ncbi:YrdB family protein [Streptomyces racemochromogenes]|uniref:YrdB family protein n=1 Tax=Streptomyces racemochromogenes TaxID=67353 RepID=A0ABW7P864_9ACTN
MLPTPLHVVNEGLAFLMELAGPALLAWWGWSTGQNTAVRILLAVGAPALAATAWGLFAAPKATFAVPLVAVLAVKALFFGSATAALYALGRTQPAVVFAAVAVANTTLAELDRLHRA